MEFLTTVTGSYPRQQVQKDTLRKKSVNEQEALEMAISTWPKDITPVVHYSESRSKERLDESIRPQAHSDYVYDYIDNYGNDIDVMIEAKHKELAVDKYKDLWIKN